MPMRRAFPPDQEGVTQLLTELVADLEEAIAGISAGPTSQFARRTFVRNVFSSVEGAIGALKRDALLRSLGSPTIKFNGPEVAALIEDGGFEVDDRGVVHQKSKRIRFKSNVRLALQAMLRTIPETDWKPDFGSKGWRCFSNAVEIRDRVTHPRTAEDLHVSAEDLEDVLAGLDWWQQTTADLYHAVNRAAMERNRLAEETRSREGTKPS